VFGYGFADRTTPPLIPAPAGFDAGASQASELFYLFDLSGEPLGIDGSTCSLTPAQQRSAEKMIAASSMSARTGTRREPRGTGPPGVASAHPSTSSRPTPTDTPSPIRRPSTTAASGPHVVNRNTRFS